MLAAVFAQLGEAGAPLGQSLLTQVGTLCAAAVAAGEDASPELSAAVDACIKAAIQGLGPAAVLETLPLNLQEVQIMVLRMGRAHRHMVVWRRAYIHLS